MSNIIFNKGFMILYVSIFCLTQTVIGQEKEEPDMRPVKRPFSTTMLIDNQTIVSPKKGGLQLNIYHRFSNMNNGLSDLFGIYGASNIKMGMNYGITDRLMVSMGYEKYNKALDIAGKYAIIMQTRGGTVPVSLSYFTSIYVGMTAKENYGVNYTATHRLAFFNQLILAKKFNTKLSMQIAPSFTHFNSVDSVWTNDKIGLSVGGKYKITSSINAIAEYDHSFSIKTLEDNQKETKPNLAFGAEVVTGTHCFQIFVSSYKNIQYAHNYMFNQDDFTNKELAFGFNITARF